MRRTSLMGATGHTVRRPQTNGHQERRYEPKHLQTHSRVHVNMKTHHKASLYKVNVS